MKFLSFMVISLFLCNISLAEKIFFNKAIKHPVNSLTVEVSSPQGDVQYAQVHYVDQYGANDYTVTGEQSDGKKRSYRYTITPDDDALGVKGGTLFIEHYSKNYPCSIEANVEAYPTAESFVGEILDTGHTYFARKGQNLSTSKRLENGWCGTSHSIRTYFADVISLPGLDETTRIYFDDVENVGSSVIELKINSGLGK